LIHFDPVVNAGLVLQRGQPCFVAQPHTKWVSLVLPLACQGFPCSLVVKKTNKTTIFPSNYNVNHINRSLNKESSTYYSQVNMGLIEG